jgi:hypothetical protein
VTSNNGRDVYIREQYYAGRSAIELGAELGLSRSQIHRIVAAGPPGTDDEYDDLTADELIRLDADEDEYPPPPWTFCGVEQQILSMGRGEEPRLVECERWITADGRPVNELDMYRWRMYQIHDHDDREGAERVEADTDRQRAEYAARYGQG